MLFFSHFGECCGRIARMDCVSWSADLTRTCMYVCDASADPLIAGKRETHTTCSSFDWPFPLSTGAHACPMRFMHG